MKENNKGKTFSLNRIWFYKKSSMSNVKYKTKIYKNKTKKKKLIEKNHIYTFVELKKGNFGHLIP